MIFKFIKKICFKIGYYLFDLENIPGQCNLFATLWFKVTNLI